MTDPVRLVAVDHPVLADTLKGKLEKMIATKVHELSIGAGYCETMTEYGRRIGYIHALRDAVKLCDHINSDLNSRE